MDLHTNFTNEGVTPSPRQNYLLDLFLKPDWESFFIITILFIFFFCYANLKTAKEDKNMKIDSKICENKIFECDSF